MKLDKTMMRDNRTPGMAAKVRMVAAAAAVASLGVGIAWMHPAAANEGDTQDLVTTVSCSSTVGSTLVHNTLGGQLAKTVVIPVSTSNDCEGYNWCHGGDSSRGTWLDDCTVSATGDAQGGIHHAGMLVQLLRARDTGAAVLIGTNGCDRSASFLIASCTSDGAANIYLPSLTQDAFRTNSSGQFGPAFFGHCTWNGDGFWTGARVDCSLTVTEHITYTAYVG